MNLIESKNKYQKVVFFMFVVLNIEASKLPQNYLNPRNYPTLYHTASLLSHSIKGNSREVATLPYNKRWLIS